MKTDKVDAGTLVSLYTADSMVITQTSLAAGVMALSPLLARERA